MSDASIDKLIPHREGMKLLDEILEVDEGAAVTSALVKEGWPLAEEDGVNPLVLIELAAQTAAVAIGWRTLQKKGGPLNGSGLLVGVKNAQFHTDRIPLNTCIITRSSVRFSMDAYTEITAKSAWKEMLISEVTLQVIRTERENKNA